MKQRTKQPHRPEVSKKATNAPVIQPTPPQKSKHFGAPSTFPTQTIGHGNFHRGQSHSKVTHAPVQEAHRTPPATQTLIVEKNNRVRPHERPPVHTGPKVIVVKDHPYYRGEIRRLERLLDIERALLRQKQDRYTKLKNKVIQAREECYALEKDCARLRNEDERLVRAPSRQVSVGYPTEGLISELLNYQIICLEHNYHDRYLSSLEAKIVSTTEALKKADRANEQLANELQSLEASKVSLSAQVASLEEKAEEARLISFRSHQQLIERVENEGDKVLLELAMLPALKAPLSRFVTLDKGLPCLIGGKNLLAAAILADNVELFKKAIEKNYPYSVPEAGSHNPFSVILCHLPSSFKFLECISNQLTSAEVRDVLRRSRLNELSLNDGLVIATWLLDRGISFSKEEQQVLLSFVARNAEDPTILPLAKNVFGRFDGIYDVTPAARQALIKGILKNTALESELASTLINLYARPSLSPSKLLSDLRTGTNEEQADRIFDLCMESNEIRSINKFSELDPSFIDYAFKTFMVGKTTLLSKLFKSNQTELAPIMRSYLVDDLERAKIIHNHCPDFYTFKEYKEAFCGLSEKEIYEARMTLESCFSQDVLLGATLNDKLLLAYFQARIDVLLEKDFEGYAGLNAVINFGNELREHSHGLSRDAKQVLIKHIKNEVLEKLNDLNQRGVSLQKTYDENACKALMSSSRVKKRCCGIPIPATLFFTPSSSAYNKISRNKDAGADIQEQKKQEHKEFKNLRLN